MKKIGIFGGTFDPIHRLHLRISTIAKNALQLDQMIFVPTGNPPHKDNEQVTDFFHRYNMVRLALKDLDGFVVSDVENQNRLNKSYTSDTLDYFSTRYPEDQLYFVVGSDSLFDIENWKNPQNIFDKAILVVFYRPGKFSREELHSQVRYLTKKYEAKILEISIFAEDLSSTEIRKDYSDGDLSNSDVIDPNVRMYIEEHQLYGSRNFRKDQ